MLPLLDYVNEVYQVNDQLPQIAGSKGLASTDLMEVADKLWKNVGIIDQYLALHEDWPQEHRQIIKGWQRRVSGNFVMERHLKKGSIFIETKTQRVYLVNGIYTSWEEMAHGQPLPIVLDATLLPFKDTVISDGLVRLYPVVIGGNMKRAFKEVYMDAKTSGTLIKTF